MDGKRGEGEEKVIGDDQRSVTQNCHTLESYVVSSQHVTCILGRTYLRTVQIRVEADSAWPLKITLSDMVCSCVH